MADTADLVVVGGGIVGCSVAHQAALLLPKSTRIVLVDRGPIAGATSGSCMGHLMVTPDDAQEYAFSHASVQLWRELHDRCSGFDYNPTGALYLADSAEDLALLPELQQQFRAAGDRAQILDSRALRDVDRGIAGDVPGALFYDGDAVVLPMLACGVMLREAAAANRNFEVRHHHAVTGFSVTGDRIDAVRTANGSIATRNVVICGGVWTPELATMLGIERLPIFPRAGNLAITGHHTSPIRTQLLEVSYLRFAHGAAKVDPTRTDDAGGHAVNMQPQTNGGCLVGSTRQFRGMDRTLNRELLHRSLSRAQRYVPAMAQAPILRTWVGLRPYSIDKHPLIGPWPHVRGLWIAAGHEGLGITLAPITGRLIAQQFAGVRCDIDHTPYLPARFAS